MSKVSPKISQDDVIDLSFMKNEQEAPVSVKKNFFTAEQKQTIRNIFSYVPVSGTYYGIKNAIAASKAEESLSLLETIKIIVQISSFLIVPQLLLGAGLAINYAVNSFSEFLASRKVADDAQADQAPVDQAPVDQAPVDQAPVDQAPVDQAPADQTQGQ